MSVKITINGKTYSSKGSSLSIVNGKVIVDGEPVELEDAKVFNISVVGDINSVSGDFNRVSVDGEVGSLSTVNGDVEITGDVTSISSVNGDIKVKGKVVQASSTNGDVKSELFG